MIPPHPKKYYMTVSPLFVVGCLLGLPTYLALVLLRYGLHVNWFAFMVGAAGGSVAGLLATIVVVRLFPTAITEEGVYGYSALGQRRFIRWQEVGRVRPFTLIYCRYLRLDHSDGTATIWLALFQGRSEEFWRELRTLAPAGNPILEHVR